MIVNLSIAVAAPFVLQVSNNAELQQAVLDARPGTVIQIQSGKYRGGVSFSNVHGQPGKPIVIRSASSVQPPVFFGGGSGMHFSNVSHLEIRDIWFFSATGNGVNIDDGGSVGKPSHHIVLSRLVVRDLPQGNHDGIKLSGVEDFRVEDCNLQKWGGSGIDMVGCRRGVIDDCDFKDGGDNGVQAKGGSSEIVIRNSRFVNAGQRGVNLGGSTGFAFFRPPLEKMGAEKYEARNLTVERCTFYKGGAPIAFVGCDGAVVRNNNFVDPDRWVVRILQETQAEGFVPSRKGVFERNLVVFSWNNWSAGGVNVGPMTEPSSFLFKSNWWFCRDRPNFSKPTLPTQEMDGRYGEDPKLTVTTEGLAVFAADSPARGFGTLGQ